MHGVSGQEMVDRFAELAQPRLAALLRLRGATLIYDPEPGALHSRFEAGTLVVTLDKWKRTSQPYRDIERFISGDRVMQFIIDPGLLPIATAMSKDILGRKLLVTRRVAAKDTDQGAVAHLEGFGVRILLSRDEAGGDTLVAWECLYGVA